MYPSLYVFLDPFNQENSGVTTYTQNAILRMDNIINKLNLNIEILIYAINYEESLECFRLRVAHSLKKLKGYRKVMCIEAPESLAASFYLMDDFNLHIRLHCSRNLGKWIQGINYSSKEKEKEQKVIEKALWISAPSYVALEYSKRFFNIKQDILVYPNPLPSKSHSIGVKDIDVLFLGRFQPLKGSFFLRELSLFLDKKISVLTNDLNFKDGEFKVFFHRNSEEKKQVLSRAKVVVVPSLLDFFSMVAIEAISCDAHIVTWSHVGVCEYFQYPYLSSIKSWDIEGMAKKINQILEKKVFQEENMKEVEKKINVPFDKMVTNLLNNDSNLQSVVDEVKENIEWDKIINDTKKLALKERKRGRLRRKLDKFMRDPKLFFMDSRFFNFLIINKKNKDINNIKDPSFNTNEALRQNLERTKDVNLVKEKEKMMLKSHTSIGNSKDVNSDNSKDITEVKTNFNKYKSNIVGEILEDLPKIKFNFLDASC